MSDINVPMPEDATPAEEDALIDKAADDLGEERVESDLDEIFKDFPKEI